MGHSIPSRITLVEGNFRPKSEGMKYRTRSPFGQMSNSCHCLSKKFTHVTNMLPTENSEIPNKRLNSKFAVCCRNFMHVRKN